MPIIAAELKLYKSTVVTNDSTNGGRLSANEITSGVKNNVWADITEAQRAAGFVDYRKVFYKVANDADLEGSNAKIKLGDISPGDTRLVIMAGTQRNTQGDLTGSERKYGAGRLNADVSAGATSIVVNAEAGGGADLIFQAGDTIYISDGTNDEYAEIDAGGVSWATDQATITLTAGLLFAYAAAAPTVVAACITQASVKVTVDNWVETGAGTYDEVTYPVLGDNIGTVEQTWTLTFSDATNYSVSGDTVGSVGSGTVGADFAPSNPDFTKPYFTLRSAGFGGTWAAGNTIVWQTHPAAVAIWEKRVTPAGANSYSGDGISLDISIESA